MIAATELARKIGPVVIVAVTIGILVLAAGRLGVRWDPFGWDRRRLEQAEARADRAEAEAAARAAEAGAGRDQAARLERHLTTAASAERATGIVRKGAEDADDAHLPLEADRADRLHAHDRELCRISPGLGGCVAASGPAGSGASALLADDPAAGADAIRP
ncbi:hypothetical protein ACO2Q1_04085 [Brevundimonas sp. VNH65]|uniref:hypothetical protein n=1 Tax=Brevundimonas sp. VNH65 TaxID=3400917 RepID=UPI003C0683DB